MAEITHIKNAAIDLENDNRTSVMFSLAQSDYCAQNGLDPQDPLCARLVLSGEFAPVDPEEEEFAQTAVLLSLVFMIWSEWQR